jgi:hypothetical protein
MADDVSDRAAADIEYLRGEINSMAGPLRVAGRSAEQTLDAMLRSMDLLKEPSPARPDAPDQIDIDHCRPA